MQQAAEMSVAAPTIEASLDGRFVSGLKDERVKAAKFYEKLGVKGPSEMVGLHRTCVCILPTTDCRWALSQAMLHAPCLANDRSRNIASASPHSDSSACRLSSYKTMLFLFRVKLYSN